MTESLTEETLGNAEDGPDQIQLGIYPTPQGVAFDLSGGTNPLILGHDQVWQIVGNLINASILSQMQAITVKAREEDQSDRIKRLIESGKNFNPNEFK